MARLLLPFVAFASLAPLASAGIKFTSPEAGATLTAGNSIVVEWEEGGTGPKISELSTYELFLCGGGDTDADRVSGNLLWRTGLRKQHPGGTEQGNGVLTLCTGPISYHDIWKLRIRRKQSIWLDPSNCRRNHGKRLVRPSRLLPIRPK